MTDANSQCDLINFSQYLDSLWSTAVVLNVRDAEIISEYLQKDQIKVNTIKYRDKCTNNDPYLAFEEMAKFYITKMREFSHTTGSNSHLIVPDGSSCYCCMTAEEETDNQRNDLVQLIKLNNPFMTLVRFDNTTNQRKEEMIQHSAWLYPVAKYGMFLQYRPSEVTFKEVYLLAGVITFSMAFLPQPKNPNHRYVNRRYYKDNESFMEYLLGTVRRLSSSLYRKQRDTRSRVEMFDPGEHDLFGCIKKGKKQSVNYGPLFHLKYQPMKDHKKEAMEGLRRKEFSHHTNFTMSGPIFWEKRENTVMTHTVMNMGHEIAKLLERVVSQFAKQTDVQRFIQLEVQNLFRKTIKDVLGDHLKEEVKKDDSDIDKKRMFDIIDYFVEKFAWCFQKRCMELYNLHLVDMDDLCINGCGRDMANEKGWYTWNGLNSNAKSNRELDAIIKSLIDKKKNRELEGIFEEKLCKDCYENLCVRKPIKDGVSCIHVKKSEEKRSDNI